jgi:phosphoribosylaminoimidazole (AIR) synthetase
MVLVVDASNVPEITNMMASKGETVYQIGKVVDLEKIDGHSVQMNHMEEKW